MPCQGPGRRCSTLCEKPLMSTLLRASSHISQELSFHTWVAMLYSSISGSCTGQVPSDECVLASCPCLPSPASPHALPTPTPTSAQPPNSVGLANWPAMLYHQGAAPTQETPPPPTRKTPASWDPPASLAACWALTLVKWNCRGSSVDRETMRPRDRYSGSGFRW